MLSILKGVKVSSFTNESVALVNGVIVKKTTKHNKYAAQLIICLVEEF
jgi:hypothetical protein